MDNNKNRAKERPKSNPELRKMEPKDHADAGIIHGEKIGVHDGAHEKRPRCGGLTSYQLFVHIQTIPLQ